MFLKAINKFIGVVIGLALLAALLAGGYFLVRYVVGVFNTLEPQLATFTAIVSVVALLCATIIAGGLKSRDHREQETRTQKAQLYKQLLSSSCRWDTSEGEDSREAEVEHLELKQRLALWGSPGVISKYAELERVMRQEESDGVQPLLKQLVMEMRKDLGQTTLNINQDDILYLFSKKIDS